MIASAASRTDDRDRLTAAELRARWLQMMHDPLVAAIPYKVELNEKGTIEVSPPTTRHAMLQAFLAGELRNQRPEGTTLGECGVETEIGVRMPDVTRGVDRAGNRAHRNRHRARSANEKHARLRRRVCRVTAQRSARVRNGRLRSIR